jgi:hypothetical protein
MLVAEVCWEEDGRAPEEGVIHQAGMCLYYHEGLSNN